MLHNYFSTFMKQRSKIRSKLHDNASCERFSILQVYKITALLPQTQVDMSKIHLIRNPFKSRCVSTRESLSRSENTNFATPSSVRVVRAWRTSRYIKNQFENGIIHFVHYASIKISFSSRSSAADGGVMCDLMAAGRGNATLTSAIGDDSCWIILQVLQ